MPRTRHPRHPHRRFSHHVASPMTLCDLKAGTRGIVRQLGGGRGFKARIAALGFTIGAPIEVIKNYGHGPIIVAVRETQVALGRGAALKIQIEAAQGASGE